MHLSVPLMSQQDVSSEVFAYINNITTASFGMHMGI